MDCVNLLIPGEFTVPETAPDRYKGYQLPVADELLESVQRYLRDDVAAASNPQHQFLARVAANSVATVRREIDLGPELLAAEAARMQALLGAQGRVHDLRAQLVSSLRDGLALDTPGLAEHLRHTVAGQLAIDQPRYSALTHPEHP